MSVAQTVHVALGERAYDVHIGAGLLARAGELIAPFAKSGRVFIVTDENVARAHLHTLRTALSVQTHEIVLPAGESQKSFAGLNHVCTELLRAGISRNDLIIAFGGGVIGDLAGFAAGIVMRGVDFVQIPTTLLAQVDSSVGGKTAIDTPEGKNLVGLFYQPRLVLADLDVLRTLPERELRAGYAEVVKYGLIDQPDFYDWCEANVARVLACEPEALAHAVRVCVEAKARIVAEDEREGGARALLNLGHTFAHALETKAGYDGALLHGEAVGTGMNLAFALSAELGLCERQDAERVKRHLSAAGYQLDLRQLPGAPFNADELLALIAHDKKAEAGKLTLILARGIGRSFVQKDASSAAVRALLTKEIT
ncbi:MAG: 3-dehydroquinate synthase [Terricaulis sp.]